MCPAFNAALCASPVAALRRYIVATNNLLVRFMFSELKIRNALTMCACNKTGIRPKRDAKMTPKIIPTELDLLIPPVSPTAYKYFAQTGDRVTFEPRATALNWANVWWLAECALLAYCNEHEVTKGLKGTGLEAQPFRFENYQAYLIWDASKVIVAIRGTDLPKAKTSGAFTESAMDWIYNLDVRLTAWPTVNGDAHVHAGFLRAATGLFNEIAARVNELTGGGQRALWLTGHSLGGALATLCAHMFGTVQGVYVFGSPRVGDTAFAAHYDRPLWRFSNSHDAVVTVPPKVPLLSLLTRQYQHAGQSVWFDTNHAMSYGESPYAFISMPRPESVLDHAPVAYSVLAWNQIE
jgi:triacylglycerol lipase